MRHLIFKAAQRLCKKRPGVSTPAAGLFLAFWQSAYVLDTALLMPSSREGHCKTLADF